MNVMVINKYKELLMGLKIEVMKSIEGVFGVDEIIDTFSNFYFDKMILDITAIKDYQNMDNIQKLAMNLNMENVIFFLDPNSDVINNSFISRLISLGIYNFTRNTDSINYLLVHPHTYKDVVDLHNLNNQNIKNDNFDNALNTNTTNNTINKPTEEVIEEIKDEPVKPSEPNKENVIRYETVKTLDSRKVIGFKNVTNHAGATSLINMLKKSMVQKGIDVSCIEINKVDFQFFNDENMISTTSNGFPLELIKKQNSSVVLVDLNNYEELETCSSIFYLIEPSVLAFTKLIRTNKKILETLKDKKVILNKCMLSEENVNNFTYETKLDIFSILAPFDDRCDVNDNINELVDKILS